MPGDGSSPRMRGTLGQQVADGGGTRFIPAHAGNTRSLTRERMIESVHPRACGEHTASAPSAQSEGGSSPRMRGTLLQFAVGFPRVRFIPAHAGNTWRDWLAHSPMPVHPRACGEHAPLRRSSPTSNGSSPRMRGTQPLNTSPKSMLRFIPAHAGNTSATPLSLRASAVHPRACGEHASRHYDPARLDGSSPRMRGTPGGGVRGAAPGRFIPAHAGNTSSAANSSLSNSVHPRACGEHRLLFTTRSSRCGSSPRMRGTPGFSRSRPLLFRFIPAHAGNTPPQPLLAARNRVHPRACGEHSTSGSIGGQCGGSSPRMRGTPRSIRGIRRAFRFIPAHAGNTPHYFDPFCCAAVHPRACGEHRSANVPLPIGVGSSPRMRGTRAPGAPIRCGRRFIPAHAGNTSLR